MRRLLLPDLLRTLAIALMVAYHVAYDLAVYYGFAIDLSGGFWLALGRTAAVLFLLLVGVSTALSAQSGSVWKKAGIRSARVCAGALFVTLATFIFDPATYVRFGILHLIAVVILLLPLLVTLRAWNLLIGALILAFSVTPYVLTALPAWLAIIIGHPSVDFVSVDYYPLLPWSGFIVLGLGLGFLLLPALRRSPAVDRSSRWLRALTFPGRHSFAIYFVHQPVILLMMWAMMGKH